MDRSRRLWLSRGVMAAAGVVGVGLTCGPMAAQARVLEALPSEGPLPVPQPGACPFCAAGKPCQDHVS